MDRSPQLNWEIRLVLRILTAALLIVVAYATGCERKPSTRPVGVRPNILLIVWDTVRADHVGAYGYDKPTTPFVDQWSTGARVFEDCLTVGSTTVPSHGAMFTGLLPYQHGANNERPVLSDRFDTLAELLRDSGYRTYMFSANPHLSESNGFTQGFDLAEHPWQPKYRAAAERIVRAKIPANDHTGELAAKVKNPNARLSQWNIKTAGALAQRGVDAWLGNSDASKPYFIFLNYMEAHRPLIPSDEYRARFLTPAQVKRSREIDLRWASLWGYTFGRREISPADLEIIRGVYDASLAELDDLFKNLLESLELSDRLDNTVVVLMSDHGEHLGEHHLLDHQFSVYQELLHVPLIVHYPAKFAPGRDARPVANFDVFPTLLELARVDPPKALASTAVSLLHAPRSGARIAAYPAANSEAIAQVQRADAAFDPTAWSRSLRAYVEGPLKLICASDGRHALYDLNADPHELHNLLAERAADAQRLKAALRGELSKLVRGSSESTNYTAADAQRLTDLGYTAGGDDEGEQPTNSECDPP